MSLPEMFDELDNGNPDLHLEHLRMIGFLYNTNPIALMQRELAEIQSTTEGESYVVMASAAYRPRTLVVKSGADRIVICKGFDSPDHLQNLIFGWDNVGRQSAPQPYGMCACWDRSTNQILQALPPSWLEGNTNWYLMGHSYGGATVQALEMKLTAQDRGRTVRCFSYGAPRTGTVEFQRGMTGHRNYRWFTDDDPVRLLPPHTDDAPILSRLAGPNIMNGMNSQVHPGSGFVLHAGGARGQAEHWPNTLAFNEINVIAWLASSTGFAANTHTLEAYEARFQAWLASQPGNRPIPAPATGQGTAEDTPEVPEVVTVAQAQQMMLQQVSELPHAVPYTAGGEGTQIRQGVYKVRKYGKVWVVTFDGKPVAIGPGKRAAKKWMRAARKASRTIALPA